jgi:hypothetical protein
MSKTKKEQTVTINDKEYKVSDLSQDQLTYINHINDLDRKIVSSQFNLDQLSVGKNAFMNALNTSLEPVA